MDFTEHKFNKMYVIKTHVAHVDMNDMTSS